MSRNLIFLFYYVLLVFAVEPDNILTMKREIFS